MGNSKKDVSAFWMIGAFLVIFFLVINLGLFVFNFRALFVERHRTEVLNGQLQTVTKILGSSDLLFEQNETFTNTIIEKSVSTTKLVSLAKNYWDYGIYVNGAEMKNSEMSVKAQNGSVTIQFLEASHDRKLTTLLHNKGAVTGGDPDDVFYNHLFIDPSDPAHTATTPPNNKNTRLYTFNNIKSGDVIYFDVSEPLNEYLKFSNTRCKITVR